MRYPSTKQHMHHLYCRILLKVASNWETLKKKNSGANSFNNLSYFEKPLPNQRLCINAKQTSLSALSRRQSAMNANFLSGVKASTVCQTPVCCRLQSGWKSKPNNPTLAFDRKKRTLTSAADKYEQFSFSVSRKINKKMKVNNVDLRADQPGNKSRKNL